MGLRGIGGLGPVRAAVLAALVAGLLAGAALLDARAFGAETPRTSGSVPSTRAHEVAPGSIELGANGDGGAWRAIPFVDGFVQQDPAEDAEPTERTRFKVAYDRSAFYVLVEALDSRAEEIRGHLTRRDQDSASDWIHVWLDTYDDHRSAYRFSVNPKGVKQDARLFDDGLEDVSWDGIWEVATRTSSTGWLAEFRIPFSQLRYDEAHSTWGFQVRRDLKRRNEKSYFSRTPKSDDRMVSHFGSLLGLDTLPKSSDISLIPYLSGSVVNTTDGTGGVTAAAGGELRMGLASSLLLDVTVNPDFGQVESDPSVLNLTPTEIYFEEKRPFFLEGKETLQFPLGFGDGDLSKMTLFYSRRIGLNSAIVGAAKLTGKTRNGWSIGLLDAVTHQTFPDISSRRKPDTDTPPAPLSNAAVVRVSKDLHEGKTTLGIIATQLFNDLDSTRRDSFLKQAVSLGFDLSHRMGDYQFLGRFYATELEGSRAAIANVQRSSVHYFQRPGARIAFDSTRDQLSGYGITTVAGKLGGGVWRGAGGLVIESPGLDANALGYLPRADRQIGFLWLQHRNDRPGDYLQRYNINFNLSGSQTFGRELTGFGGNVNLNLVFQNYSSAYAGFNRSIEALDVMVLRGGPALKVPGRWDYWFGGRTDDRARYWLFELNGWGWQIDSGAGSGFGGELIAKLRPASSLEISLGPKFEHGIDNHQYVDTLSTSGAPIIVGHLNRDTVSLAARASWTLDTNLSVQLYLSPYLSGGMYTRFNRVSAPLAASYRDRFEPFDYQGSNHFLFKQLRSNLVLRWEYALGSTLFVVWSHDQTDDSTVLGPLYLPRDLGELLGTPSTDTVIVKLAHWFQI